MVNITVTGSLIKRALLILLFIGVGLTSFGQSDTLNRLDNDGKKQGYWIYYGSDKPERGHQTFGKIEEGYYVDNRKDGKWIKYFPDGISVKLILNYKNNRPSGEYTKYYENGIVAETGSFVQGKNLGHLYRYYENGCLRNYKFYNNLGHEDTTITYYYADCDTSSHLIKGTKELEYQKTDGVTVDTLFRYYPNGELKEFVIYNDKGAPVDRERFESTIPLRDPVESPIIYEKDRELSPNGYNKVYNTAGEIWMEGEFKDGKLWKGKIYTYDSDGLLLKVEIWEKGKYHSETMID